MKIIGLKYLVFHQKPISSNYLSSMRMMGFLMKNLLKKGELDWKISSTNSLDIHWFKMRNVSMHFYFKKKLTKMDLYREKLAVEPEVA